MSFEYKPGPRKNIVSRRDMETADWDYWCGDGWEPHDCPCPITEWESPDHFNQRFGSVEKCIAEAFASMEEVSNLTLRRAQRNQGEHFAAHMEDFRRMNAALEVLRVIIDQKKENT